MRNVNLNVLFAVDLLIIVGLVMILLRGKMIVVVTVSRGIGMMGMKLAKVVIICAKVVIKGVVV